VWGFEPGYTSRQVPHAHLEELFDSIGDSNIFTIVDLKQIMFTTKDHKKTTFHGNNKLWKWLVMPFGLKNAPVFSSKSWTRFSKGQIS
jgi:hypothetical protein